VLHTQDLTEVFKINQKEKEVREDVKKNGMILFYNICNLSA
jgi:hypothetical protein